LIVGPLFPLPASTVDITVQMPNSPARGDAPVEMSADQFVRTAEWIAGALCGIWIVLVGATAIWLSRRVIAKERSRREATAA
ncbi:MAG TPA: hypothetical protein VG943_03250, partial [Caulobacterales bacterium]|nr:hypothetical protein [Caulobacterales bacterium]